MIPWRDPHSQILGIFIFDMSFCWGKFFEKCQNFENFSKNWEKSLEMMTWKTIVSLRKSSVLRAFRICLQIQKQMDKCWKNTHWLLGQNFEKKWLKNDRSKIDQGIILEWSRDLQNIKIHQNQQPGPLGSSRKAQTKYS